MIRTERGTPTWLRFLSIAVPLVGVAVLYLVRLALLGVWPVVAVDATLALLIPGGVLLLSWAILQVIARQDRSLARQHAELTHRYETERLLCAQLEALHQASLAIASAQTPAQILQRLVDLTREIIGARYAALGVLSPQGAIDDVYTAGISPEERARIGPLPQGHGLLGVTVTEGATLRLPDVAQDPRSVGFPPGHPVMHSLLTVPVAHGATVVGNLYLADKVGAWVRHAHAGRVWITLDVREHAVHLRIRDNSVGFDTNSPLPPGHYGLRNLRERARGLGVRWPSSRRRTRGRWSTCRHPS